MRMKGWTHREIATMLERVSVTTTKGQTAMSVLGRTGLGMNTFQAPTSHSVNDIKTGSSRRIWFSLRMEQMLTRQRHSSFLC